MNPLHPKNIWNRTRQNFSQKLQTKLLVSFAGIGIFAVLLVGFYSFHLAKEALLFRTFEQLTATREAKRKTIEDFINNKLYGADLASSSIAMGQMIAALKNNPNQEINNKAVNIFLKGGNYQSIIIILDTTNYSFGNFTDRIRFTNKANPEMHRHIVNTYNTVKNSNHSAVLDYVNCHDTLLLTMASPALNEDGTLLAVVALTIRLEFIDEIMLNQKAIDGLGNTGETYLVGNDAYLRSTSKFQAGSAMKVRAHTKAAEQALNGKGNTLITEDYRGVSVLSSFSPIDVPGLNWAIIAEIDEHEILAPIRELRKDVLIASGIVLIILIIVIIWVSRKLSRPLAMLRSLAIEIEGGAYGRTISVTTNDEVGQLTEAFNAMSIEIDDKRKQLEDKNRKILDSITYAKRLQTGLHPSSQLIEKLLQESFVIYVPKDIVSGDFYYLARQDNNIIFGVGDCTGHGVPGAFVSGIGMSSLQRTVKAYGKTKPSEILDTLNEIVIEIFSQSDVVIRDGMDIALCSIDFEGKTLQYAGANNSMYYIRNGELNEIKADKQPIGKYSEVKPFVNHELTIREGDCIYMLSDGFVDQFGGPNKKKFMLARLKQLLLEIHQKPMVVQKTLLEDALASWKGDQDQIDDICVFGARL